MNSENIFNILEEVNLDLQNCRSIEEFQFLDRVNEGTFGVVYRGSDKKTGDIVALKHFKKINETTGFSIAAQRELDLLMEMEHINIVTGHEIAVGSRSDEVFLVMEYVPNEINNLMHTMLNNRVAFGPEHVKCIMVQLLTAVQYLHHNSVFHRDLKPSNILITEDGILKQYTPVVVTRWYRAPELLLRSKTYGTPIDMWSVGCIFAELMNLQPLFPGSSEIDQLKIIFEVLGTPSDTVWPGYSKLTLASNIIFDEFPSGGLRKKINQDLLSDNGFSLLLELLTYDPSMRATSTESLLHPYFDEQPLAVEPAMFMTSLWSEYSSSDTGNDQQYSGSDTWYDEQYSRTDTADDLTSTSSSSTSSNISTKSMKHLKKINEREGYSIAARRELEILHKMQHPNIVAGRGLASSSRSDRVYIVMELVDYDLKAFMETMHSNKQLSSQAANQKPRKDKSGLKKAATDRISKNKIRRDHHKHKTSKRIKKQKQDIIDAESPFHPAFQRCRSVDEFQYLYKINEGSFRVILSN
uniref:SFRICE_005692 n=1 Tax=Spodoptera frugiperda TaxID=7108 RepID=A0A2H1WEC0_SPOFR